MTQTIAEMEQSYRKHLKLSEIFRPPFHFVPFNPTEQLFHVDSVACQVRDQVTGTYPTIKQWPEQTHARRGSDNLLELKVPINEMVNIARWEHAMCVREGNKEGLNLSLLNLPDELNQLGQLEDKLLARKYSGELTGLDELRLKHIRARKEQLFGVTEPKPEEVKLLEKYEALLDQGKELIGKIDQLLEQESENGSD